MKILLVHNFYRSSAPCGEDIVYRAERDFLASNGHRVIEYTRRNDDLVPLGRAGPFRAAFSVAWNFGACRELRALLLREVPDIMHVHNTFPQLSPAVFHAASGTGTATVLTTHNYRLFCAAGTAFAGDSACTECAEGTLLRGLVRGCYRQSRIATLPLTAAIALHRVIGTWRHSVDAVIALTEYQRALLISSGVPPSVLYVKPHFHFRPDVVLPWGERENKVVFIGRVSREKGVRHLVEAWVRWGSSAPILEIVGDGPESAVLQEIAARSGVAERIRFLGQLPFEQAQRRLAAARLLVLPSVCPESFGLVLPEAFAAGVPVAASRLGAMACIVKDGETGILFEPGDPEELLRALAALWGAPAQVREMSVRARADYESRFTPESHGSALLEIYESALARRRGRLQRYQHGLESGFHPAPPGI